MNPTILPPPPRGPYAVPSIPALSAIGADRVSERLRAVEAGQADIRAGLAEVRDAVNIDSSRVTLLVREVAKLRQAVGLRVAIGSAVGSALVAMAARLVG